MAGRIVQRAFHPASTAGTQYTDLIEGDLMRVKAPKVRVHAVRWLLLVVGACDPRVCARITEPSADIELAPRLQVDQQSLTLTQGSSTATGLTLVYDDETLGQLSLGGSLPIGVSATFDPPQTDSDSRLTLTATDNATPGLAVFDVVSTITAYGRRQEARTQLTVQVVRPFRISAPPSRAVMAGTTVEFVVGVTRAANFDGAVGFDAETATLPAGTAVLWNPSTTSNESSTVRFAVPSSATAGRHFVRIVGTSRQFKDTVDVALQVTEIPVPPDITLAATPAARIVFAGDTALYDLAFTRNMPGIGAIGITTTGVPSGTTVITTPAAIIGTSAQLAFVTTSNTPPGTYTVGVTATAGTIVKQTSVTLTVNPAPDFSMIASPNTFTVVRGGSVSSTVLITRTGNVGAVQLGTAPLPTGFTATFTAGSTNANGSVTIGVGASVAAGFYTIDVTGVAVGRTRTARIGITVLSAPPPSVTVTVATPQVVLTPGATAIVPIRLTRTGTAIGQLVELRVNGIPPGGNVRISPTVTTGDTATLQIIGGTPGQSIVTVSVVYGAFPPAAFIDLTVAPSTEPNFSIITSPDMLTVPRGIFTNASVNVVRANGFAGEVNFDVVTDSPGNYAVEFSPISTTGSGVFMRVYASPNVPPGTHVLVVRGYSGGQMRTTFMTLLVQ
ncbi:MAG: hypothetical protein IT353_11740 [Gemmatimonadaceae bacterium]|nr:hypothetical protein [Gemmatimonadaceae bacterium]